MTSLARCGIVYARHAQEGGTVQEDWNKWRLVLSPVAVKLWRLLDEQRHESPTIRVSDLTSDLRASKTAVRRAIDELAEHGFIAVIQDSEYDSFR